MEWIPKPKQLPIYMEGPPKAIVVKEPEPPRRPFKEVQVPFPGGGVANATPPTGRKKAVLEAMKHWNNGTYNRSGDGSNGGNGKGTENRVRNNTTFGAGAGEEGNDSLARAEAVRYRKELAAIERRRKKEAKWRVPGDPDRYH